MMATTSPCSFEVQPCLHGNHQVDVHRIHRRIWQRAEEQFDTCVMNDDVTVRIVLVARASSTHQDTAPGSWMVRFQTTGTALGAAGSLSRIPVHVLPA